MTALPPRNGTILAFGDYLARARRERGSPLVWPCRDIDLQLARTPDTERGTLALCDPRASEPGSVAPGLSLTVQVVRPGACTSPHAHSFWHLYIVRSGAGEADFGKGWQPCRVSCGDIILLPPWTSHSFDNRGGAEPLVMLALQNLPEQARLGSLARTAPNGALELVQAAPEDDDAE